VRREVEEELGISALPLKIDFLFFYFQEVILNGTYIDRQFNDVYITRADISLEGMRINQSEVSEVTFVPFEQFQRMVANGSGELAPVYTNECRDLVYFMSRESGV
jgi:8-oxo-dGTP pyrophosphatase MutT (NUDIX family)